MTAAAATLPYLPVLELPPLSPEDYAALKENIAANGVLVPIIITEDRRIIDGNNRKQIADELGLPCPEVVHAGLPEEAIRLLARSLNLSRRHLTREQKRQIVADQLAETPGRSNRWIARQLGVDDHTVASVRVELESNCGFPQFTHTTGADGKSRPAYRTMPSSIRSTLEVQARLDAATLLHGDCREILPTLPDASVDAVITDPPYPETDREYGRMSESDWVEMMRDVVTKCRRILKPNGSMVVILQPNSARGGRLRTWHLEFALWAAKVWNIVQDAYWHAPDTPPVGAVRRTHGLLRPSVKWCLWLGEPGCFRNQEAVLRPTSGRDPRRMENDDSAGPSGMRRRDGRMDRTAVERGGSTPCNLLSIPVGGGSPGAEGHPAVTPLAVASWWVRYLLPEHGVLLDPFAGAGTMLLAGLDHGAARVVGIEKEGKYMEIARRRISGS